MTASPYLTRDEAAPRPTFGIVYFIEAVGADRIKIGWTATDPLRRMTELQNAAPFPLKLLATVIGTRRNEREFHAHFAKARAIREWFDATPELRRCVAMIRSET